MSKNTNRVIAAAQARDGGDSKTTWALADAVLAAVPDANGRNQHDEDSPRVGEMLQALADALVEAGVQTPRGEAYSTSSLSNLREQAMAWPVDQRHTEAAYRTHQEASNETARKVLAALCAISRGETGRKPAEVDAASWATAKQRVQQRKHGWKVAANDVRIAMQRPTNVPGGRKPDPASLSDDELHAEFDRRTRERPDFGRPMPSAEEQEDDDYDLFDRLGEGTGDSAEVIEVMGELAKVRSHIRSVGRSLARIKDAEKRAQMASEIWETLELMRVLHAQAEGAPDTIPVEWAQ